MAYVLGALPGLLDGAPGFLALTQSWLSQSFGGSAGRWKIHSFCQSLVCTCSLSFLSLIIFEINIFFLKREKHEIFSSQNHCGVLTSPQLVKNWGERKLNRYLKSAKYLKEVKLSLEWNENDPSHQNTSQRKCFVLGGKFRLWCFGLRWMWWVQLCWGILTFTERAMQAEVKSWISRQEDWSLKPARPVILLHLPLDNEQPVFLSNSCLCL